MIKKRNFNFFCFLMSFFLFFTQSLTENAISFIQIHKKIHGAIAFTAITPLLNLNLNYEKLRRKYNYFYQTTILNYSNFCIFKYQYLFSMFIKGDFRL